MYETNDGREWGKVIIEGIRLEMFWDSGASTIVMSECSVWFSTRPEIFIVDKDICDMEWKIHKYEDFLIVRNLHPPFIGGIL